jgi:hypothetical protein
MNVPMLTHLCFCGCGQTPKGSKSMYLKGHGKGRKGQHLTEEHKRNLSVALKTSPNFKPMIGKDNPMYEKPSAFRGKKHSKITLEKMSKTHCENPTTRKDTYRPDLEHITRSEWEYNICKILKKFNIPYKYEAKSFPIKMNDKTIRYYKPDIQITESFYIEIRGYSRGLSAEKLQNFIQQYPFIKLIVIEQSLYTQIINNNSIIEKLVVVL